MYLKFEIKIEKQITFYQNFNMFSIMDTTCLDQRLNIPSPAIPSSTLFFLTKINYTVPGKPKSVLYFLPYYLSIIPHRPLAIKYNMFRELYLLILKHK